MKKEINKLVHRLCTEDENSVTEFLGYQLPTDQKRKDAIEEAAAQMSEEELEKFFTKYHIRKAPRPAVPKMIQEKVSKLNKTINTAEELSAGIYCWAQRHGADPQDSDWSESVIQDGYAVKPISLSGLTTYMEAKRNKSQTS